MRTARPRSVFLAMLCAFGWPLAHADALGELDDVAARIQYAFHTADTRAIEDALTLLQRLELPQGRAVMKEYYAAYAQWKLAESWADEAARGRRGARARATQAAKACEEAADNATRLDPRLGEAHAMHAICTALAGRAPDALSLNCAQRKELRTARELEPQNPRIRLIEAQCMLDGEKNPRAMLAQVAAIAKTFDAAPATAPGRPDWGHAETLLLLGRLQLQGGDTVAARDSLERALIIAPDYRKAREQLEQARAR